MKAIISLFLGSCAFITMAQQEQAPPAPISQRIGSFADEAGRTLAALDPAAETERTCAQYTWIASTARALATELDDTKPHIGWPTSEIVTAFVLANEFKCSDPDVALHYQYTGLQLYADALRANRSPSGHGTLVEVSDLARQADRARTALRLERLHRRLQRRLAELEEFMASR